MTTALLKALMRVSLKKTLEYQFNLVSYLVVSLILFLLQMAFWQVVFGRFQGLAGWQQHELVLLYCYVRLFSNLDWALNGGAAKFWRSINTGELDVFLTKPINPVTMIVGLRINTMPVIQAIIDLIFICSVRFVYGVELSFGRIALSVIPVLLMIFAMNRIYLALNYTAFFTAKSESIVGLFENVFAILWYPITIYPHLAVVFFTFVVPLIYLATYPVMFVCNHMEISVFANHCAVLVVNVAAWAALERWLWKKGLQHYESTRG